MPILGKYDPKPHLALPEEAWYRIEHTLGLDEPDYGLRSRIARYVDFYFLGLTAGLPRVQVSQLRKQLKRIRDDAARLRSDLGFPDGNSDGEWTLIYAQEFIHNKSERDDLLSYLSKLIVRADEALHIVIRGRWPPGERYGNLILALATAYRIATNEEPTVSYNGAAPPDNRYSSKFFNFVVSVLDAVGDKYAKPHNNQALGKRIGRGLEIRRRMAGA